MKNHQFEQDVCIIGGLGHVGLPLGIALADKGVKVCLCDINKENAELVRKGKLPFIEYGAEEPLLNCLKNKTLSISDNKQIISKSQFVIVAIGTPVDEYLNPKVRQFLDLFKDIKDLINEEQIIIIRSTVYPRTCDQVLNIFKNDNKNVHIAYCPERIAQGYSMKELHELPQIVSGMTKKAIEKSAELFEKISPKIIKTSMREAELVKLFLNSWRYIQFAVTNQFYMIANNFGVDYTKVRNAMVQEYGRAASLPAAGFAAGPCLLKDTMQLVSFNSNNFMLGHAAMMINEGLPNYIVDDLRKRHELNNKKVGILGMAFKADIDDIRDSLSFKLGKVLRFHGANVYYSDEFVNDKTMVTKEELLNKSEIVIVGVPHSKYKEIQIPKNVKEVVDLWGILKKQGVALAESSKN